ncbi:cell division protein FtsQ/DivIB [Cognatishimia activa]|uniref:Cell division protein FtsQ n=1 Tax=Cognatishimia activa TaxID=1715691 RepID=A0A975EPP1_9RHOB|nr:cell division protein FtsQ/DivIB [Cognatishimia activa]QTN35910.1 cell division protein FtsQ [Cognatishimia activa]
MQQITATRPSYYRPAPKPQPRAAKSDPAPSRFWYRYERMMLTPLFRFALRVVAPFVFAVLAVNAYFADQERSDNFFLMLQDLRTSFVERPEFMVGAMTIDGAGPILAGDIREVLHTDFPISSFDIDVAAMRETLLGLSPVKSAQIKIDGNVLQIAIEERTPVLLWRTQDGLQLVDAEGFVVSAAKGRLAHGDLPLMAGVGADVHAKEALQLLKVAAPLGDRVRGLAWVGNRRWDIVLDRDQRIMLPENGAVGALERIVAMAQVQDLLERDVSVVDLRIGNRPTLRVAENSVENWWDVRKTSLGVKE